MSLYTTLGSPGALTLGDTWALLSNHDTGLYPHDTPQRRAVKRSLAHLARILGETRTWATVGRADITTVGRRRVDELLAQRSTAVRNGYRGAQQTITHILTVAAWLRDHELIPPNACGASKRWKRELMAYWKTAAGSDTGPRRHRPRYTLDEMRRIIDAAPRVDPRLALALAIGAELRLGQVARTMRSELRLGDSDYGAVRTPSAGNKKGATVFLTTGQRRHVDSALTGYLAHFERRYQLEGVDYPLIPTGKFYSHQRAIVPRGDVTAHIHLRTLREWYDEAEILAGVPHVRGRGWYGMRRAAVDAFKGARGSREALKEHGGWASTELPDTVYADPEAEAPRLEARNIRARIRGEGLMQAMRRRLTSVFARR